MTDYIAVVDRFGADAVIGEMDCVYSSWITNVPQGFSDAQVSALRRLTPFLALAIKSSTLVRIARTLVETYLGRDPGRRVLKGSITRGASASIEAVLWFSDLHDYTRISDGAKPDQIIPMLDDYADAIISAIYNRGGDVLKLIGDGTLAIFTAEDRGEACRSALAAAQQAFADVATLKAKRLADGFAGDEHVSRSPCRRRSTAISAAASVSISPWSAPPSTRSAASRRCAAGRSTHFSVVRFAAAVGAEAADLVSVGRYALRGVGKPQHLFTLGGERPAT